MTQRPCSPPSILPIPNLLPLADNARGDIARQERECFVLRDGKFQKCSRSSLTNALTSVLGRVFGLIVFRSGKAAGPAFTLATSTMIRSAPVFRSEKGMHASIRVCLAIARIVLKAEETHQRTTPKTRS